MNTFLIVSETIYNILNTLKSLTNGINNVITFNLEENTLDEVLEEASYFSMFDDRKCLVVKNAKMCASSKNGDSKKIQEDTEKLLKYWQSENKQTRLIFILNGKADTKKKIYNIIKDNGNLYTFKNLNKTETKNELLKIANNNGYKIDDNSLWYIINNTLGNFDLALSELNKIMLYYSKPTSILYDDVVGLTSKSIENNNFKIVDSIISKDLENSLKYLEDLKVLKVEPNIIISLLYREFKLMLMALIYEENKYSYSDTLREMKLAEWQYNKVRNNLRMYKKDEIEAEIVKLSKLDYAGKSGLINKDIMLITYILDLCS